MLFNRLLDHSSRSNRTLRTRQFCIFCWHLTRINVKAVLIPKSRPLFPNLPVPTRTPRLPWRDTRDSLPCTARCSRSRRRSRRGTRTAKGKRTKSSKRQILDPWRSFLQVKFNNCHSLLIWCQVRSHTIMAYFFIRTAQMYLNNKLHVRVANDFLWVPFAKNVSTSVPDMRRRARKRARNGVRDLRFACALCRSRSCCCCGQTRSGWQRCGAGTRRSLPGESKAGQNFFIFEFKRIFTRNS